MTSRAFDLYGAESWTLDELRVEIERVLGMHLEYHESDWMGGEYLSGGDDRGENVVVQHNRILVESAPEYAEPAYAEIPILIQLNATTRGDVLQERLRSIRGVSFLRRTWL